MTKILKAAPRLGARLTVYVTLALTGTAVSATIPARAQTAAVSIDNFTFTPDTLTITPGTTVTWTNADDIPHTVTATDKSFRSKPLDTSDRFALTFATPGSYGYFCSLHPHMTGKIVVKAP